MLQLKSITRPAHKAFPDGFPFSVPVIQAIDTLEFTHDVTFFVGENGSGKSTLLEAIACAASLPTIGSDNVSSDPTLKEMRALAKLFQWSWAKKLHRGFFMRSEDFFGFARRISEIKADLLREMKSVEEEFSPRGKTAVGFAAMPYQRELAALREQYGDGLDAQSHGESFFKLFRARMIPDGLYLMDEPEAPLSPTRQLTLIALIHEMVKHGGQFIIATHSPILLAYPGAAIWSFDGGKVTPANYEDLEHVKVTREFLNNPEVYLRHLID